MTSPPSISVSVVLDLFRHAVCARVPAVYGAVCSWLGCCNAETCRIFLDRIPSSLRNGSLVYPPFEVRVAWSIGGSAPAQVFAAQRVGGRVRDFVAGLPNSELPNTPALGWRIHYASISAFAVTELGAYRVRPSRERVKSGGRTPPLTNRSIV